MERIFASADPAFVGSRVSQCPDRECVLQRVAAPRQLSFNSAYGSAHNFPIRISDFWSIKVRAALKRRAFEIPNCLFTRLTVLPNKVRLTIAVKVCRRSKLPIRVAAQARTFAKKPA